MDPQDVGMGPDRSGVDRRSDEYEVFRVEGARVASGSFSRTRGAVPKLQPIGLTADLEQECPIGYWAFVLVANPAIDRIRCSYGHAPWRQSVSVVTDPTATRRNRERGRYAIGRNIEHENERTNQIDTPGPVGDSDLGTPDHCRGAAFRRGIRHCNHRR